MRRLDQLIAEVRAQTKNEEYGTNRGIQQNEMVRYMRDAQARIENLIKQQHPNAVIKEAFIDVATGQEEYSIPSDAFASSNVINVEYSVTGNSRDYYKLDLRSLSQRCTATGNPEFYIPRKGKILINPIPYNSISNGIRLNYQYSLPSLDIRRGTVSSSVINVITRKVTSITFANDTNLDSTGLTDSDYVCVVDRYGNFLMRNLICSSYNSGTRTLSIDSSFTYNTGETLPNGSYVTIGKYTTTHSQLDDICERYLNAYTAWKILKRDSNVDASDQQVELQAMEQEIVDCYAQLDEDVDTIPLISNDWIG